ncbi:MAG: mannose-1-phosphate guanylyltransferase [Bifidobacteriaceae bacterium]|jgi:mannose-1-phosphate guanylyltransferase|nr:mannose-1-phosphate guanylyltransferase [Bifidobacteriaceae bacterium]
MISNFYPIIPAGGGGTRLWPLSRKSSPKFLYDLTGSGRSLLQSTVDRLLGLVPSKNILIITGQDHIKSVTRQLPELPSDSIIDELTPKDSMAAIGLTAAILHERHGDVVFGSFAADHVIENRDNEKFYKCVEKAVKIANDGYIATIGICPTDPTGAFGYIEKGGQIFDGISSVKQFVEKPSEQNAKKYFESGSYLWNAGIFVAKTSVLLNALKIQKPELYDGIIKIANAWDTPKQLIVQNKIWDKLEKVAIDYAIAEPVSKKGMMAVVEGDFSWTDVGDWDAIASLIEKSGKLKNLTEGKNVVLGDSEFVHNIQADGNIIFNSQEKLIVLLGVEGLAVIDSGDAVLVTRRDIAQKVKVIVPHLQDEDLDKYI